MTYPLSSPVSAGQPTAADHYNNLRKDALNLGQADADVVNLGTFLKRFASAIKLEYLATNRVRVPYVSTNPPTLVINGCMLQATANVDLPAGLISGAAATWYFFAVRTPGSTTFTLTANTSPSETTDQRIIGQAYWDGSDLKTIQSYLQAPPFPPADYDSGWFSCATSQTYTKAHGLGNYPRLVKLYHSANSAGSDEWVEVTLVDDGGDERNCLGLDAVSIYVTTGATKVVTSMRRSSATGYYRLFAWL